MAITSRFRSVALALRPYVSDTYNLLEAADALTALVEEEVANVTPPKPDALPHWFLVRLALRTPAVMQNVYDGKKIAAIKELRALGINGQDASIIGLRAAKDAVEDPAVWGYYVAHVALGAR